jgi:hypothetical protein
LSTAKLHWLVFGFPFFGMTVAGVIGISIYAALEATDELTRQFEVSGLARLARRTGRALRLRWPVGAGNAGGLQFQNPSAGMRSVACAVQPTNGDEMTAQGFVVTHTGQAALEQLAGTRQAPPSRP